MKKTKVLFVTGKLQRYRLPILNIISQNNDISLSVAHSSKKISGPEDLFEEIIISEKKIGPFTYHDGSFIEMCKQFDVVVAMFYIQKISFMSLLLYKKHFKLIYWGIGVVASYKNKFDTPSYTNTLRHYVAKKADAMIFYTNYVKEKYINNGFNSNKLFVMPNTVSVLNNPSIKKTKNCITFLGTINKSKNIFILLNAYLEVYSEYSKKLPNLEIIGSGEDFKNVEMWVASNKMENKIILHGAIYESVSKAEVLRRSYINISPSQAGLSVLECFGYGLPFATSSQAITGGERLNIIHHQNGFLMDENNLSSEIKNILKLTIKNPEVLLNMGLNAQDFYFKNRSPNHMVDGFVNAINFVTNK